MDSGATNDVVNYYHLTTCDVFYFEYKNATKSLNHKGKTKTTFQLRVQLTKFIEVLEIETDMVTLTPDSLTLSHSEQHKDDTRRAFPRSGFLGSLLHIMMSHHFKHPDFTKTI